MNNLSNRQKFEAAFAKRLGESPTEFIQKKLYSGSKISDIRYLYDIMASEIARQNNCPKQDFSLYYPQSVPTQNERPKKVEKTAVVVQKKLYHKLVRDRIPEIIETDGNVCVRETLSDEEYLRLLDEKLDEEVGNYQQNKSLEELADLLEVLGAVVTARGYTWNQLTTLRKEKREQKGGFEKRILLKEVQTLNNKDGKKSLSNAGKPWTKAEESMLIHNFRRGYTIPLLAQQHRRTEKAIRFRLEQLGEITPEMK
ncbi:MAG: nucleoside triphosphate pyrophosphohydrolase [Pygmaiobacter massiliensis]|nr:nucleoside triphosphate pyrophosphohydrolase [Pygmaiobacter massiliensis]